MCGAFGSRAVETLFIHRATLSISLIYCCATTRAMAPRQPGSSAPSAASSGGTGAASDASARGGQIRRSGDLHPSCAGRALGSARASRQLRSTCARDYRRHLPLVTSSRGSAGACRSRRNRCRVLLLLAQGTLCAGKLCDVFEIDGKKLCGPSLLLPGMGKCSTNALDEYTRIYAKIKWATKGGHRAEIDFDPRNVDLAELVRTYNPGVTPDDPYVWAIKDPVSGEKDPLELGTALKRALPSARVVLTLCDPSTLPFRWFRHYVTRTLRWAINCSDHWWHCPKANTSDLMEFMTKQHYIPRDLGELFSALFPPEGGCHHSSATIAMFNTLAKTFHIGANFFSPTKCTAWEPRDLHATFMGGEVGCGSRCIRRWLAAGYKLPSDADGGTLTTVFMEAWKDRGLEYIRRIARSLELELPMRGRDFDWAKTHNFAPVYATKLAGKDQTGLEDERTPADHLDAARSDCPVLAALLGETVPWPACARTPPHVWHPVPGNHSMPAIPGKRPMPMR